MGIQLHYTQHTQNRTHTKPKTSLAGSVLWRLNTYNKSRNISAVCRWYLCRFVFSVGSTIQQHSPEMVVGEIQFSLTKFIRAFVVAVHFRWFCQAHNRMVTIWCNCCCCCVRFFSCSMALIVSINITMQPVQNKRAKLVLTLLLANNLMP